MKFVKIHNPLADRLAKKLGSKSTTPNTPKTEFCARMKTNNPFMNSIKTIMGRR